MLASEQSHCTTPMHGQQHNVKMQQAEQQLKSGKLFGNPPLLGSHKNWQGWLPHHTTTSNSVIFSHQTKDCHSNPSPSFPLVEPTQQRKPPI